MPIAASLNYSISGGESYSSKPLVLIHGAGSSLLAWPPRMRRLAGWKVLALDLPGHGESAGIPEQSVENYARYILDFMDELGYYRFFAAGHSMGSAIGLHLARHYPERLYGLVLFSIGACLRIPALLVDLLRNPGGSMEALKLLQPLLFAKNTSRGIRQAVMGSMQKVRPGILFSDYLACYRFDFQDEFAKIQTPLRIANGSEDRITPPSFANHLASRIAGAKVSILEGAGHMLIVEKPVEATAWLNQALEDIQLPG